MKLLLPESGGCAVDAYWADETATPWASVTLLAEARAALASARRAGRIDDADHTVGLRDLEIFWEDVLGIDVTETLARRGGELAEQYRLRGYDAIHLATAEAVLDEGDVMVCADRRLARAAESIGLEVVVPQDDE